MTENMASSTPSFCELLEDSRVCLAFVIEEYKAQKASKSKELDTFLSSAHKAGKADNNKNEKARNLYEMDLGIIFR
ncbi:hypothetical protein [Candidatus Finniella inopinata]|uniref:hypothetical protein n=1 Tax=Candidatus Finniella inopinata TaxID=1696036 RepID=UPI001022B0E2|nr:hypothetical protein [Candidatus Finniella inopinata]